MPEALKRISLARGLLAALLLTAAGGTALMGLFSLSHLVRLDSLLVASQAATAAPASAPGAPPITTSTHSFRALPGAIATFR